MAPAPALRRGRCRSTQSCALSVSTYDEPSMAMVPPSSALAPARWQTSRPSSAVIGVIGSRPISRSVACTCCSGTTFRNGDWRSCSAERFAKRVVEHRVAGAIHDRRQHDAVFLRQRRRA